jgi:hypothetical protein
MALYPRSLSLSLLQSFNSVAVTIAHTFVHMDDKDFIPKGFHLLRVHIQPTYRRRTCTQPFLFMAFIKKVKKVKQSRYTPWRRLGGEEI